MEVFNINFAVLLPFFCFKMLRKRGLSGHAVSVRLSVCLSRSYMHSVKTNKHISNFFSPSGRDTILIFRTKRHNNIVTEPPSTQRGCRMHVGRQKDSDPIYGLIACCERCDGQLLSTRLSADTRLLIDAC